MKRFYKKIDSTLELKTLDDLAAADGKEAVGISNSGSLYKWNRETKRPEKINNSEAISILQVTPVELNKIVVTRGTFELIEPVQEEEVQEPTSVKVITPTEAIVNAVTTAEPKECEKNHYNDLIDLIKTIHEEVVSIKDEIKAESKGLKEKVTSLESTITELKNFIVLE